MQDMLFTSRKPLEVINQKIDQNACAYLIDFDTEMSVFRVDGLFKASLPLNRPETCQHTRPLEDSILQRSVTVPDLSAAKQCFR